MTDKALETMVASLAETLQHIESLECSHCEAQEIAGGALAYAPHQHELGLLNRKLEADNARLREALRHSLSLNLQPAEDFDEADSEWCHNQRAALEAKP